ncbi:MAG: mercury resistance system periplasmic binding protein MerP [Burkholderiales bacterium]
MKNVLALLVSAFIAAIPLSAAAGAAQTVKLDVKNMTCAACPITVKKALMKVPGVESAKVDFESGVAVVAFDPDKTNVEALTKATGNAGFPSSLKR